MAKSAMTAEFEPKIVGFLCNWCSYAGADMTVTSRIPYPPNIRIIRVPCSGRVDPLFVPKAFRREPTGCWWLAATPAIATTPTATITPAADTP